MYTYMLYVTESNHVVPKTECATLYSCFWLVGRHQQGVAYGFYRARCTSESSCGVCPYSTGHVELIYASVEYE